MDKRGGISKDKLASGLLRGAVVSGLAAGLAAASLGGIGTANATCIGFSGLNLGGGCKSTFGNFALVLGTGTASANGFFTAAIGTGTGITAVSGGLGTLAYAGGTGTRAQTQGILNLAAAGIGFEGALGVGTNVSAQAGLRGGDFLNIAVNLGHADNAPGSGPAASTVTAGNGAFNLAGNLLGNANSGKAMTVLAGGSNTNLGFGNVAANVVGNRNIVHAIGILNNATNWGNVFRFPNGSDNTVTAAGLLSWAFNYQGIFTQACDSDCGNIVNAMGPLSLAGAIGVINRTVERLGFGVKIATPFNDTGTGASSTGGNTNVLAAGGTQKSVVRPSLNFTPGVKSTSNLRGTSPGGAVFKSINQLQSSTKKFGNQLQSSAKKFGDQLQSSAKKFGDQLAASNKKFRDSVNTTRAGAKASAASTNNSDK